MVLNRTDHAEASVTRRSILKTGIAISAIGASGAATGIVQGDNANGTEATEDASETHTLTVTLTESGDAGIVSGEVTVGDQTKTTTPLNGDPARIQAEFEFENGTYSASGTSEINDKTWRTKEKEVTIDGEDASLSFILYPPESDELSGDDESEETKTRSNESLDESNQTDGTEDNTSDDTATNTSPQTTPPLTQSSLTEAATATASAERTSPSEDSTATNGPGFGVLSALAAVGVGMWRYRLRE